MLATMTTIADIRAANRAAGFHFFERSTMRFFDSRVLRSVYEGPGGVYFLTSEQFHGSNGYTAARKFTVRQFYPATGDISTAGEFNAHDLETARALAKEYAHVGRPAQ